MCLTKGVGRNVSRLKLPGSQTVDLGQWLCRGYECTPTDRMDKMSKKDITPSDDESQTAEPAAEVAAAPEVVAPEEAGPEKIPAAETDSVDVSGEPAAASSESADGPSEEASSGSDDTSEEKPRARPRARRSRSRRKPRSGEKNGEETGRGDNKESAPNEPASADKSDGPKKNLRATALWGLHKERRAKMVPFAGYEMPVQYKRGIMDEHRHTRSRAGLFDVSHMGQAFLTLEGDSEGGHEAIAALIEELVPGNIRGLKAGGIRYTLLLNDEGGIIDDLMITRPEGAAGEGMLFLVVNAGCKEKDFAHIAAKLKGRAKLTVAGDRALMALQGPQASRVMSRYAPFVAEMPFMTAKACRIEGVECIVSRCGYTGEDGFEISLPNEQAEGFARKLLTKRDVALVGLGARDSLRLEAGLCLYGHDIDEETTPVEANLVWAIAKRRKLDKDFPAAEKIMAQIEDGTARRRVGILPEGKAPARDGTNIVDAEGNIIGKVTSGGFGPTVRGPIAMGYVDMAQSDEGTEVGLMVRGQSRPAKIAPLPFIPPKQYRPGQEVAEPAEEPPAEPVEEPASEEGVEGEMAPAEDVTSEANVVEASTTEESASEETAPARETEQDPDHDQSEDKEEDGDERP